LALINHSENGSGGGRRWYSAWDKTASIWTMSGIVGVLRVDEAVFSEASLDRMLVRMSHRGPDGAGLWISGRVGLGHQSFRSTPESRDEILPYRDASLRLVLTADAKLDNRNELISSLCPALAAAPPVVSSGITQLPITDSHLICAAYRRWGRQCLDHLEGAFAFALWDEREQVLLCARDHFGVRPFYYDWLPGHRFAFASEIRPLLELPDTRRQLNESRIADFLLEFEDDRVETYYQGIRRLPPSHCIEVRDGRLTITCYWSPDPVHELHLGSDREYSDAFRERFEAAVRKDMRSSRPWAVALSGGIDSSSVACVSRGVLAITDEVPLNCFCIHYDSAPGGDEREYYEAVLQQGGIVPHYLSADRVKPLDNFRPLLECYDGPIDNPHFTLGWSAWEQMRQSGFRVLLDGVDGDVTVSYAFVYLQELARRGSWLSMFREALGLSRNFFGGNISPFSIMWEHGLQPLLPRLSALSWEQRRRRFVNGPIIRSAFGRRMDLAGRIDRFEHRERSLRSARAYHCDEVTHGVIVAALEKTNKICSALGIEPRHPFFDKRLVEFCIALPREQRTRDGWTRMIVRRALADLLPAKVLYRGGKWAPSRYFAPRLLQLDRDRLRQALATCLPAVEPYFDTDAVRTIFERSAAQPGTDDAFRLWNVIALGAWLQDSALSV
jgi:asparagine synthase (glutamine-hydrolysing)